MDRTTVTRNLRSLLDQGLVALGTDESDARVRRALITASGRAAFGEAQHTGVALRTSSIAPLARAMLPPCTHGGIG